MATANALLAEHGHEDLRLLDNGAIVRADGGHRRAGPRLPPGPGGASKANAVAFHMRARGYAPEECIAIGDSWRTSTSPTSSAASSWSPTAPNAIPALREAIAGRPNVTVTEGRNGEGVYEAVVSHPGRALLSDHRPGSPQRVSFSSSWTTWTYGSPVARSRPNFAGSVAGDVGVELS